MNDTAFPSDSLDEVSMPTMQPGLGPSLGRIDQYDLVRKLGGGGFGVVYLARDIVSGVEVALKTLHPLLKHNAEEMDLLREKFRLVSRLTHQNVAKALVLHRVRELDVRDETARQELKLSPGDSVMVMDFAPGVTLSKWRRQFPDGIVPPDLALEIGRQLASALDYAHGERIVHRDIKPGNVMVETLAAPPQAPDREEETARTEPAPQASVCSVVPKIRVRILDFGLAAEIRSSMSRVSTEAGDTSGTRPYMAPEQWMGRKQDGRTDQYALACVLYELLSGAPPFAGVFETGDPAIMANAVSNLAPEALEGLDPAANAALLRALAKDPKDRFPTCAAFVAALARGEKESHAEFAEGAEFGRAFPPGAPPDGGGARSPSAPQGREAPTADEESALFTQKIALGEAISGLSDAVRSDSDTGPHAAACARAFAAGEEALKYARFSAAARCFEQAQAALDRLSDIEKRRREAAERAEAQFARFRRAEVVLGKESPPQPRAKGLRWAAGLCVCGALLYCLTDLACVPRFLLADVFLVAAFILWWRRGRAGERTMGVLLFLSLVLGFLSPVLGFGLYGGIVHEFSFCGMMLFAVFAVCLIGRWRIRLAAVVGLIGLCLCNRNPALHFESVIQRRSIWGPWEKVNFFWFSGTILLAAGLALRAFLRDEPRTAKESDGQGGAIPRASRSEATPLESPP